MSLAPQTLGLVALGGAIGATLRFAAVGALLRLAPGFPWGTVAVNVLGSFAMGVLAVLVLERLPGGWARLGPLLLTGVLGGFTTFSAFSLDTVALLERGRPGAAAAYVLASVAGSVAALALGLRLGRALWG